MKKYLFCNNCGKQGHLYHRCKKPISSIGIIAFRNSKKGLEYLMICRKDSLGYVDFMRGKYPKFNESYIQNIINEMTIQEKNKLLNNNFEQLWEELWGTFPGPKYRGEEKKSSEKFQTIKERNLKELITKSKTNWKTPEWGFPKGRRNYQENDLNCALREFQEETGYSKKQLNIINNLIPIEEIFLGSNMKSYKHKYFLAFINKDTKPINNFQQSEVSEVKWLILKDCLNIIRPYNYEKKKILNRIDKILNTYKIIT